MEHDDDRYPNTLHPRHVMKLTIDRRAIRDFALCIAYCYGAHVNHDDLIGAIQRLTDWLSTVDPR